MYNSCTLLGRVGHDPEIRVSQSGKKVCRMSLATNTYYSGKLNTDWHTIVCFEKNAEYCEKYVKKGAMILVNGSIQYSKYKGKDGIEKTATTIIANVVRSAESKDKDAPQAVNSDGTQTFGSEVNHDAPDEIPF